MTDSSTIEYAHSHTYNVDGKEYVLEPIAVLKVDDQHPFPEGQGLNLVQIAELAETVIALGANVMIKLTNLLNVGAVPPPPPQETLGAEAHGLLGEIEHLGEEAFGAVKKELHALGGHLNKLKSLTNAMQSMATAMEEAAESELLHTSDKTSELRGSLHDKILAFLKYLATLIAGGIAELAGLSGEADNIGRYAELFQTIVVPNVVSTWQTDEAFAHMRVAGPNPLMIARVQGSLPANFPVDGSAYQRVMGAHDSLADAIAEDRLYLADYTALDVMENGTFPLQKYITAPLALFAIPKGTSGQGALKPVAIQCHQQPSNTNPIFYPFHDTCWELAKVHVQVADGNYHELISHLGLTHFLVEPFVVSSFRKLPSNHPVLELLLPHFQGTLFINNAALNTLINPGGTVDSILGGTITSDWEVTTGALTSLDFNERMLRNQLAQRGVLSPSLPLAYPYRDDALAVWGAVEQWAHDYLAVFYADDAAVAGDAALQAWVQDLTSQNGGRVGGLGEQGPNGLGIYTFDYLVQVVTMVIFTASAQHAAVNFPQKDIMSYTPAMPLAAYAAPPIRTTSIDGKAQLLTTLPPLQQAVLQQFVGQGLGGVYFTRLGDYSRHQRGDYFTNEHVQSALAVFQQNLTRVEQEIGSRNMRRPSYTVLLPSRIPQSINI